MTLCEVRSFAVDDLAALAAAFGAPPLNKPAATFERYLREQNTRTRAGFVALAAGAFAGYVTVCWDPAYPGFAGAGIPEIQDLNVLPAHRRRGIATRLLDRAEREAGLRARSIGIGVGLHPGYNVAQRLYGTRGYIPDGRGLTYRNRYVEEGATVAVDDDLVLHFVKRAE